MLTISRISIENDPQYFSLLCKGIIVKTSEEGQYWEKYFKFFINTIDAEFEVDFVVKKLNELYQAEFQEDLASPDELKALIREKTDLLLIPGLVSR